MERMKQWCEPFREPFYVIARVLAGLLFLQHGVQKLFGGLGGDQVASFASLTGVAGIMEFVVGIFLVVGFLTRLTALVGAFEMLVAYVMAHAGQAWAPIMNGGETALLYFIVFLLFIVHGGNRWSIDAWLFECG